MDARSWMMLKVLVNRYNPKAGNTLLKFLPPEEAQMLAKQEIASSDIEPMLYQPQRTIERMHYSWLQPLIEDHIPEQLKPVAIAALKSEQAKFLRHGETPVEISEPVRVFFINQIYEMLNLKEHMPLEYLPETELSPLTTLSKKNLVALIDFLGLHDLAYEVRSIVNKKYLENIYSCLSQKQLAYLKVCLQQKEKLKPRKLGINPAERNAAKLKGILHHRGILRFSYALAGQHKDLVWYIAHTLDSGRGKIILKLYKDQPIPNVTSPIKTQVTQLMNFLK